jgi:hypothetical protein
MTSIPVVITVLYIRAETLVNASERSDDTWTATFPTLEMAKQAPMPGGARRAVIHVEGGHLARTLDQAWDFVARAGGDGMDAARE